MFTALCTLAYLTIYNNVGIKISTLYMYLVTQRQDRSRRRKADTSEAQEEKTEKGKR